MQGHRHGGLPIEAYLKGDFISDHAISVFAAAIFFVEWEFA